MEPLTPTEQLDLALNMLKSISYKTSFDTLHTRLNPKKLIEPQVIPEDLLNRILDKLIKDGYVYPVQRHTGGNDFAISFEGYIFSEAGGYKKQLSDSIIQNQVNNQNSARLRRHDALIVFWTSVASIVGLLLLGWQIFLYFCPSYKDCPCWIWETIPK